MIIRNRPPRVLIGRITTFTPFVQPPPADGITSNTDIPGLPDPLDTPGEITAKIEQLEQNQAAKLDEPRRVTVSPAQAEVTVVHTLGRQPTVRSVKSDGTVIQHNVQHNNPPTQFTCYYSPAFAGVIEFL